MNSKIKEREEWEKGYKKAYAELETFLKEKRIQKEETTFDIGYDETIHSILYLITTTLQGC